MRAAGGAGLGRVAIPFQILLTAPLRFLDPDAQGYPHLLVEHEQMLGAIPFRVEPRPAIEPVHGTVDRLVGAAEARRHQVRVVEIRQRRVRIAGASVEDGRCQGIELGQVRMRGWYRESVVDDTDGIHVVARVPSPYASKPCASRT